MGDNTGRSLGLFPFLLGAQFSIWINDRESVLAKDAKLELTIHFADKTSAKATLDVKGIAVADKTGGIVSAEYKGLQRRDIPGLRRMRRAPRSRGRGDEFLLTEVTLKEQGTIVGFRLRNTAGPAGTWDTAMERGNDLLLVLPPNSSEMLNDQDGAVNTPIDGERTFHLLAAENDALSNPDAQTTLYVFLDGNRTIQKQIARAGASAASSDGPKLKTVEFRGKGAYDFVSDADKPGANLNPDSFIAISLNATGTLSGIKVVGTWDAADGKKASATWDSIPSNSNPALVVTRADGKPVNRLDGSLSEQIGGDDDLLIWFDTGAPITKSYSFTVTLLFSDGKALEGNTSGSM